MLLGTHFYLYVTAWLTFVTTAEPSFWLASDTCHCLVLTMKHDFAFILGPGRYH
jgi:hypothetical protein